MDHPTSNELGTPQNAIKDSLLFNNGSNLLLEALGDIDSSMYTSTPFIPSYTPENERISLLVSPFVMEDPKYTQGETQDIERSPLLFESVSEERQQTLQQEQRKHTEHCDREECRNALEEVSKQKSMVTRLQNEIRRLTSVKQASKELVSSLKRKLRVTQELDVSASDLIGDADRQTKDEECMYVMEEDNPSNRSKTGNNHNRNKEPEIVEETGSNAKNRDKIEPAETDGEQASSASSEPPEPIEPAVTDGEQASGASSEPPGVTGNTKQKEKKKPAPGGTAPKKPPQKRKILRFRGQKCPLSNFFSTEMRYRDRPYNCLEQAYQHTKADEAQNEEIARAIMKCTDPVKMKRWGEKIPDSPEWNRRKRPPMKELVSIKSKTCQEAQHTLLTSGDAILV